MHESAEVLVVEVCPAGCVLDVKVVGEIDSATAPRLTSTVIGGMTDDAVTVILDLGELTFCDSSGVQAFVQLHEAIAERGAELILDQVRPAQLRLLQITGVDRIVAVKPADIAPGTKG